MKIAQDLGMRVVGTDMEEECIELASAHGACHLLDTNDRVSPFGINSFDVVCCFHVLEHVPSPVLTVNELRQIARKYVLLAVPNLSAFNHLLRPLRWVRSVNEGHLQSWDHAHFKNLLEVHCGLNIVS